MTRVKRGNVARKRRNKILDLNRGFRGSHSTLFRTAQQRSLKALSSSYSDRRKKKRDFRRLWIRRINAGSRAAGMTYSVFMHALKTEGIGLNLWILSFVSCSSFLFNNFGLFLHVNLFIFKFFRCKTL